MQDSSEVLESCIFAFLTKTLEFIIDTHANHVVGTAVGLCAVSCLLLVIAVDAAEVASIETHLFVDVPCATKTHGVAVAGKGGVLLVTVAQTVVGTLAATTDGKLVIDVVLHTGKNLMGTMRQFLLAVIGHLGILVVTQVQHGVSA